MGLKVKSLGKGAGAIKKFGKATLDTFTTPNVSFEEGGGLTSLLIPRVLNNKGLAVVGVGMTASSLGGGFVGPGFSNVQNAALGKTSYSGMARMVSSTSHAAEDMMQLSGGNYSVFADMAGRTLSTGIIDNYGADSNLIKAMYGMH